MYRLETNWITHGNKHTKMYTSLYLPGARSVVRPLGIEIAHSAAEHLIIMERVHHGLPPSTGSGSSDHPLSTPKALMNNGGKILPFLMLSISFPAENETNQPNDDVDERTLVTFGNIGPC